MNTPRIQSFECFERSKVRTLRAFKVSSARSLRTELSNGRGCYMYITDENLIIRNMQIWKRTNLSYSIAQRTIFFLSFHIYLMLGKLSSYYASCKLKCLFLYVSAFDGSIYRMNLMKFYIKLRNVFHLVLISAGYAAFTL